MKKSLSTKILALFMAVLMLVTAVPFVALAGPAEDRAQNQAASDLMTSITNYEDKVDDQKVYHNMANAYSAYIAAKKAYDAYVYGGANVDLKAAKSKLDVAIGDMTDYSVTDVKYNARPTWHNSNNSTESTADGSSIASNSNNIVWIDEVDNTYNSHRWENTGECCGEELYYSKTVLVYDGVNTPRFPVMMALYAKDHGTSVNNRYLNVYKCFISTPENVNSDSKYFQVDADWHGNIDGELNYSRALNDGDWTSSKATVGHNSPDREDNGHFYFFASSVIYKNDISDFNADKYTNKTNLHWTMETQCKYRFGSVTAAHGNKTVYGTDDVTPVYVINIVPIKTTAENAVKADFLQNIENYNEGDVLAYMKKIDDLTKFNLNTYFNNTTVNSVDYDVTTTVENAIDGYVKSFDGVTVRKATDYSELKTETAKAWAITDLSPYTTSSVSTFNTAFKDAKAAFGTDQLYNGFKDTIIPGLKGLEKKADFAPVNEAVAKLAEALEDYQFTADTLKEVKSKLDAMKYYNNTDKDNVPYTEDSNITTEGTDIEDLIDLLVPFNSETSEAVDAKIKAAVDNKDKYDTTELKKQLEANRTNCGGEPITIAGKKVTPIDEDEYARYALTAINTSQWPYTVTIDEDPLKDEEGKNVIFHYGDIVDIPVGNYEVKITAGETSQNISGMFSNGGNVYVRGNMEFTSCDKDENATFVKFVTTGDYNVIITKEAVDGKINLDDVVAEITAPAYHEFSKFLMNGKEVSGEIAVEDGAQIIVVFKPTNSEDGVYSVKLPGAEKAQLKYNKRVDLTNDNPSKVFAKKMEDGSYRVISTANKFTFYVCENIEIELINRPENITTQVNVIPEVISMSDRVMFIGSYADTDKEVVGRGFILDRYGAYADAKELTLANVEKGKVLNLTVTKNINDVSNQFTFYVKNCPTMENACYVSYVTYADGTTVYSNIVNVPISMVNAG